MDGHAGGVVELRRPQGRADDVLRRLLAPPTAAASPATSKNSVRVAPGHSATTRTRVLGFSCATASVNERTKALVAPNTAIDGTGWKAAVLATLTTAPRPRATMPGR